MEERLRAFANDCGMFERIEHDPVDDEWMGVVERHLIHAVEPDGDKPGLALVDELPDGEPYRVETAVEWRLLEEMVDGDPAAVVARCMDAILIRLADDLHERLAELQGEGDGVAIEREVRGKLSTVLAHPDEGEEGEPTASLALRFLFSVGRIVQ